MNMDFERGDFENFLRESLQDFRMFPSVKVWSSIYNELHPGSRWPSLAAACILFTGMILIGLNNGNDATKNDRENIAQSVPVENGATEMVNPAANTVLYSQTTPTVAPVTANYSGSDGSGSKSRSTQPGNIKINVEDAGTIVPERASTGAASLQKLPLTNGQATPAAAEIPDYTVADNPEELYLARLNELPLLSSRQGNTFHKSSYALPQYLAVPERKIPVAENVITEQNERVPESLLQKVSPVVPAGPAVENHTAKPVAIVSPEDKSFMDEFAAGNKPAIPLVKKLRNKSTISYYVTPSVGFRSLENYQVDETQVSNPANLSYVNSPRGSWLPGFNQSSALNIEAGASMAYKLNRRFAVKAGLQLNITNYEIFTTKQAVETETLILLKNETTGSNEVQLRKSSFANADRLSSDTKLNNKTFQLSLPVGFEYRILGGKRWIWKAGVTGQPTYVRSAGNTYVLSYDMNNYIMEKNIIRPLNLNIAAETNVAYRLDNGLIIFAGPQIRHQLLSTYKSNYQIEEKLYNAGMKIGFTKAL